MQLLTDVHRFLVERYDLNELQTLCFDLGANYDDLAGTTLSSKARELTLWAARQRKLDQLLAALRNSRSAPFEQAGLSLEPSQVEGLYRSLNAFESSTAPQSWWTRFRRRPWVFYPTLVFVLILVLVVLASGLVGIAGGLANAQQALRQAGLLPVPLAFAPAAQDESLVVVATFQRLPGVVDVGAQDEIRRGIRQAAERAGFGNLRVEVEPTQLAEDDQKGAQALGERYHATMVIWGAISGVRVAVNYLNLKQPDFAAAQVSMSETQRTQLANPSAYSSFITHDLPGQMSFLSLFAVGQSFYSQKRYSDSIRAIEGAVVPLESGEGIEGLAEAYFRLGWLYLSIPDPNPLFAIADLDKAIKFKPDDSRAYYNRGLARYYSGDLAGAIADYSKTIELEPTWAEAYTNRGLARRNSGDLAGAIADYNQAIENKPRDATIYNNRGVARAASGDLVAAIADYDKAIELKPDLAEAYNDRGFARQESGDLAGAIADYDKAIELKPDLAGPYNNRGRARAANGDLTGAIADYDKAIELKPDLAEAYNNRGFVEHETGDLAAASADYNRAIQLKPKLVEAYNNRGHARSSSGDIAGAIADYDKVIQLQPNDASALNGLCWTYALQQQAGQALPYCDRALKADPQPPYRDSRGLAYALLGNSPAAIADFQAFMEWLEKQPGSGHQALLAQRKAWIEALQAGQNPFTPDVLAELRTEN